MPTIVIYRTGGIGDVILSTVSLRIILEAIPGAHVIWMGRRPTLDLISAAFPGVTTVELVPGSSYLHNFRLLKNITGHVDLIIDLQRSARTMLLGIAAAAHFICPYTTWNKFSIKRTLLVMEAYLRGRQERVRFFEKNLPNRYEAMATCTVKALRKSGFQTPENALTERPWINTPEKKDHGQVSICLGALYPAKALPGYKLEQIIETILNEGKTKKIHLLGDATQFEYGEHIRKKFSASLAINNQCGKTSLWEAAVILTASRYSVANDSALAHLSEAVKTPVLMFFGPTHEKFGYRPHLRESRSFSSPMPCRPCTKGGETSCRYGDFKCMHDIGLEQVFNHLQTLQPVYES